MSSAILQLNYPELQQISKTLRAEGEDILRFHNDTRRRMEALRKDWIGEAASKFYSEMEVVVLPATLRTARALETSDAVLLNIVKIIQMADQETAGYFGGLGADFEFGKQEAAWDWQNFVDGLLGIPGIKWLPIISIPWGIYMDMSDGDDWSRAIFSELAEYGLDLLLTASFPPYMIYPAVITWLHGVSGISELTGGQSFNPAAELIFEVAKFFDPSLTEADQGTWFQNTAEWLDLREEAGDLIYDAAKFFSENTKIIAPGFVIYTGPGSPFASPAAL